MKYENIIKMSVDLMAFTLEIIYKKKGWGIYNKSWWVLWYWWSTLILIFYVQNNDVTYFDSFGVEHIPKEIKTFIGHKNIKTNNIFRIKA